MNTHLTKTTSYYIAILVAFFFLSWAAADIVGVGINVLLSSTPMSGGKMRGMPPIQDNSPAMDGGYDSIYRQMILDRLGDSSARFIVSGIAFVTLRRRIRRLEGIS